MTTPEDAKNDSVVCGTRQATDSAFFDRVIVRSGGEAPRPEPATQRIARRFDEAERAATRARAHPPIVSTTDAGRLHVKDSPEGWITTDAIVEVGEWR